MREIEAAAITEAVRKLCIESNYVLPADVRGALEAGSVAEESPVGKAILADILENADIAAADRVAVCQDTGFAVSYNFV